MGKRNSTVINRALSNGFKRKSISNETGTLGPEFTNA
jgi:hypothetical protein